MNTSLNEDGLPETSLRTQVLDMIRKGGREGCSISEISATLGKPAAIIKKQIKPLLDAKVLTLDIGRRAYVETSIKNDDIPDFLKPPHTPHKESVSQAAKEMAALLDGTDEPEK
jgi:hypothetical protein